MQIAREIFVKSDIRLALRALLMAICAGICCSLVIYSNSNAVAGYVLGAISLGLLITAIVVLLRPVPDDRACAVTPHIVIPAPLIRKGLDTQKEPITYFMHLERFGGDVQYISERRMGLIKKAWFNEQQWHDLLTSLPANPVLETDKKHAVPRLSIAIYVLLCLLFFCFSFQSELVATMQQLQYGAFNWALAKQGELYRLVSHAFLHANFFHFAGNATALALAAGALQKSYTNLSMLALMTSSALVAVTLGTLTTNVVIILGASGVVFGLFGFLTAAQREKDQRLHPFARPLRYKVILSVLLLELVLIFMFKWYGGTVHLVGFVSGALYYYGFEARNPWITNQLARSALQWLSVGLLALGTGQWLENLYHNHKAPYEFVDELMSFDDPVFTGVAGLVVPDNPDVTEAQVVSTKQQALSHIEAWDYNALAVARADLWLGNTEDSRKRLRTESAKRPDNELAQAIWLAAELQGLESNRPLLADNTLPPGNGGALLVSEQGDYLARLRYSDRPRDLNQDIIRPPFRRWALIGQLEDMPEEAQGTWPLKANQYRTRDSAMPTEH